MPLILSTQFANITPSRYDSEGTEIERGEGGHPGRPPNEHGMSKLNSATGAEAEIDCADILYPSAVPFVLVHLACFAAIWTGVTWESLGMCVVLYWARIFGIGAGYHRYFS